LCTINNTLPCKKSGLGTRTPKKPSRLKNKIGEQFGNCNHEEHVKISNVQYN